MKKIFLIFFLTMLLPKVSVANFIDTQWKVVGYVGETWFSKPENIIGKYQEFYKGFAEGVFYSCDYAGQSATYNTYDSKEFLKNKEFSLFKKYAIDLKSKKIFVHRITCNGKKAFDRKVMYPFITIENSNRGYYLFEGAIFILEYVPDTSVANTDKK